MLQFSDEDYENNYVDNLKKINKFKFNPFVLPLNWNFRPIWHRSFFGPIKIWHDYSDPPLFFDELSEYYQKSDAIIQYHHG